MLTKKSNRDKNYVAQGHDYLSNHLWVSLLTIRYRDLSSDTLSNFTEKERYQIRMLRTWLSYFTTLSVLVICQSNSKNSRRILFICKYPQLCSPRVKINFRLRFPCAWLSFPPVFFVIFSPKRMNFIIKVSVDNFCKENFLSYDSIIMLSQLWTSATIFRRITTIHLTTSLCPFPLFLS